MKSILLPGALLAASLTLGGCTMLDGFGGLSAGYGDDGYYDGYDPYYDGYDRSSHYGWYDSYYYPGTGYYVYDRGGARHRWSDRQRSYWEQRRGRNEARENWSGYRRDGVRDGQRGRDGNDQWNREGDRDGRGRDWRPERRGDIAPGVAEGARVLGARPGDVRDAVRGTPRPRREWAPGARRPSASGATNGGAPVSRVERSAPVSSATARAPAPERVERPAPAARERRSRTDRTNPNVRDE